jgi:hypothetical protein
MHGTRGGRPRVDGAWVLAAQAQPGDDGEALRAMRALGYAGTQ